MFTFKCLSAILARCICLFFLFPFQSFKWFKVCRVGHGIAPDSFVILIQFSVVRVAFEHKQSELFFIFLSSALPCQLLSFIVHFFPFCSNFFVILKSLVCYSPNSVLFCFLLILFHCGLINSCDKTYIIVYTSLSNYSIFNFYQAVQSEIQNVGTRFINSIKLNGNAVSNSLLAVEERRWHSLWLKSLEYLMILEDFNKCPTHYTKRER